MEENTPGTDLTLEELKNKFENYRKNKSYQREPIPKEFWETAAELARKQHSIATVCRELRLRHASLKEHIYSPPIRKKHRLSHWSMMVSNSGCIKKDFPREDLNSGQTVPIANL
jgi:hypothetical protein